MENAITLEHTGPFPDLCSWNEEENFKKKDSANPIWHYFLRHINGGKAKCTKCDKILSIKGGCTGAMRSHMKMVHKMKVALKSTYVNSYLH